PSRGAGMNGQVMPAPSASLAADPVAVAVQLPAVAGVAGVHGGRTGRARGIAVLVVGAAAAGAAVVRLLLRCGLVHRGGGRRRLGLGLRGRLGLGGRFRRGLLLGGDDISLAGRGPLVVVLDRKEALAVAQHAFHGVGLGGLDPQVVLVLHGDLPGHVLAAVVLERREPGGGVAVALLPVQAGLDGEQVQRVVGELAAGLLVPARSAGLPGVGERDDVIDVDRAVLAIEVDGVAAVRGVEGAALDDAAVRPALEGDRGEVAAQNVVSGVAAVAVHVVAPAEQVAVVVGLRTATLLVESGEDGERGALGGDGLRGGGGRRGGGGGGRRGGRRLRRGSGRRRLRGVGLVRRDRRRFEDGGLTAVELVLRDRRAARGENDRGHEGEGEHERPGDQRSPGRLLER